MQLEIDELLEKLTDFRSVSIKMQEAGSTLATFRELADALMLKHPCPAMEPYLAAYGARQTAPAFTAGVAKIQAGMGGTLTAAETEAIQHLRLLKNPNYYLQDHESDDQQPLGFAERVQRAAKRARRRTLHALVWRPRLRAGHQQRRGEIVLSHETDLPRPQTEHDHEHPRDGHHAGPEPPHVGCRLAERPRYG